MTKPNSGAAKEKSDQLEGESAAVRVPTDAASEHDTTNAKVAVPGEGEANVPRDAESKVGTEDSGAADAAISDDAETGDKAEGAEPAKPKRRTRSPQARSRSVNTRRGGQGNPPPVGGVTTPQSNEAAAAADARGSGEVEAAISDDAETGDKAEGAEPAKPKRRTRSPQARTRSVNGRRGGQGKPSPVGGVTTPQSNDADEQRDEKSVEGEAIGPSDAAAAVDARGSGEVEAAISDDADTGENAEEALPAPTKRRVRSPRARARSGDGRLGEPPPVDSVTTPQSNDADDQRDEKSVEGEAKGPSEAAVAADARESGEVEAAISDDADTGENAEEAAPAKTKRQISWPRVLVYGLLPGLALSLALAAGYLKWQDSSARATQIARIEAVAAAKDSTIVLLSYQSDTVEKDLDAAKVRLTGTFKESYAQLIKDVVIPGSKREHISTKATVPAASVVSATPDHAVTLLFVNQTAVVDKDPPADSSSSVRVTLDKVGGRWLISGFDPV